MDSTTSTIQGQEDTQAASLLDDKLKAFNAYLDAKYPDQASNQVRPPFIDAAAWPIRRADFGIDDEWPWNDDLTLTIIVQPYADMQVSDMIKLFWNGVSAGTKALEQHHLGEQLVVRVKGHKVPAGDGQLLLKVMRSITGRAYETVYTSVAVTTVAWFECPGDQDENLQPGEQGEEEDAIRCKLDAPSVQVPAGGVLGLAEARQGVKVTIAPYSCMGVYDTIRLYWGSQMVERLVLADEVGEAIVIEVDERVVRAAGDGDPLVVQYDVIDEVGNASRDWSKPAEVKVQMEAKWLEAPEIIDPVSKMALSGLDLTALGERDLQVKVSATVLEASDRVAVTLVAVTHDGKVETSVLDFQTVAAPVTDLLFGVPGSLLRRLGGGFLQASYTIERNGSSQGAVVVHVPVTGGTPKRELPLVSDAAADEDGDLRFDPDLSAFFVTVPLAAGLQARDKVTVTVEGVNADGEAWIRNLTRKVPDPAGDVVFRFMGAESLKPAEGGWLDISYMVERQSTVINRSDTVKVLVGELLETLPAPGTEMALKDENLDPTLQVFKAGVFITIAPLEDVTAPYVLRLFWETSAGSHYESEQDIEAGESPEAFHVPQSELALGDSPLVYATVYYMIYQQGKPDRASEDLEFTISTEVENDDLGDYLEDGADGSEVIDSLLRDFDSYLKKKNPNEAPAAIPRPFIYGAEHPGASVDFGIGAQLLKDYDDQLLVLVKAWEPMAAGDTLQLFWGGELVANRKVLSGQEGQYVTLAVQENDIPLGHSTMYCQVRRKGGDTEQSGPVSTLVLLEGPGVQGEQGVGQALPAPVVALPSSGIIGAYDARGKVRVTIAPYLNMRANDLIYLFWGDERVDYRVTETQVGKPIVITVDENTIVKAGDGNELPVYYYIADEAGNESQWSDETSVKVNLLNNTLAPPELRLQDALIVMPFVVDRQVLGSGQLTIQMQDNAFQVGDSVLLYCIGTTEQEQNVHLEFAPLQVTQPGQQLKVGMASEKLEQLTRARFYYTLTRNGVSSDSKRRYITIKGAAFRLPAPTLKNDVGDWIDADLETLLARIPLAANLQQDDFVTLEVVGTKSDGNKQTKHAPRKKITAVLINGKLPVPIALKGIVGLKPFEGGYIDVSYEVSRGERTFRSETARWYVGYLAETLPAPRPEVPLVNNTLDPSLPAYAVQMGIVLPTEVEALAPCTITLYWAESVNGYDEREVELKAGDSAPTILLPRELYAFGDDEVVEVEVYYTVDFEDKPSLASEDLLFRIATSRKQRELLPEPKVPQAYNDELSIFDVPGNGLLIEVPAYAGMAIGDNIVIKFGDYTSTSYKVARVGVQAITLAATEVVGNARKSTEVSYEVTRGSGGDTLSSVVKTLMFDGNGDLERFEALSARKPASGRYKATYTSVKSVYSAMAIYKGHGAAHPEYIKGSVYATTCSANDTRPCFILELERPALKLRLHIHGYGILEALDLQGRRLSYKTVASHDQMYVTLTGSERQRIAAVKVHAKRTPNGGRNATCFLGLAELLIVY